LPRPTEFILPDEPQRQERHAAEAVPALKGGRARLPLPMLSVDASTGFSALKMQEKLQNLLVKRRLKCYTNSIAVIY